MQLSTYSQLKTKISNDYDITDENFITDAELMGYYNDAIDSAETAIHTLHHEDKYFLTLTTLSLVSGTQDYSLPSDIYGNKIRLIQYDNGADKYKVQKIRDLEIIPFILAGDPYTYLIINTTSLGTQIRFYPALQETSSNMTMWYIRSMKRITQSSDTCEVLENNNFTNQYVKYQLSKKTKRADLISVEANELKIQYDAMLESLKEMTVDQQNEIPPDTYSYNLQTGSI